MVFVLHATRSTWVATWPRSSRAAGDRVDCVHVADTMDHHRVTACATSPIRPATVRVHQHLKIGDGDVDWDEFFAALAEIGFYDRADTVMVSSVFAEDETRTRSSPLPAQHHDRLRRQVLARTLVWSRHPEGRSPMTGSTTTGPPARSEVRDHRSGDVTNPATGEVTGQVALATVEDARAGHRRGRRGLPRLARHLAGQADVDPVPLPRAAQRAQGRARRDHHRRARQGASPTPLGEVSRGQEVVEFACGMPHLLKGGFTENASTEVDVYSIRQPLGAGRDHLPVQLPGDGADVVLPHRDRRRQHRGAQALGEGPLGGAVDGRAVARGRVCPTGCSTSCTATRSPSTSC